MTIQRKVNLVSFYPLQFKCWQRPALRRPRRHPGNFCREEEQREQGWETASGQVCHPGHLLNPAKLVGGRGDGLVRSNNYPLEMTVVKGLETGKTSKWTLESFLGAVIA